MTTKIIKMVLIRTVIVDEFGPKAITSEFNLQEMTKFSGHVPRIVKLTNSVHCF